MVVNAQIQVRLRARLCATEGAGRRAKTFVLSRTGGLSRKQPPPSPGQKRLPALFASLESSSWASYFGITPEERSRARAVCAVLMCRRQQAEARGWAVAAGKQVPHPPGRAQRAELERAGGQALLR